MRCLNCGTANPPQAKFCLECGTRLNSCPNCGTVNPPQAKFCIECGTSLQARKETPPAQVIDSEIAQPIPQITGPLGSSDDLSSEERRIVTVMFADITGSTPLASRMDPEDMRAILTGYFNLMTKQIRKHDGTVEKYIGDAVMAVFGAPVAHEDDPDRAIRAALDMQIALTKFNEKRLARDPDATRLQMRIGINTGEVATPSNSSQQRQDFLITGDAVNIAARLQQVATPDTILVGERTYLSARDVFEFKSIAPLQVKGKPEPITAYVVQGLKQHTPTIPQHPRGLSGQRTPLVGRTLELTLLHASYARVQAEKRPHLITILGVPGVGKSRIVREFIVREQELVKSASASGELNPPLVLKGRCPPYGESITYWPLIEILRSLLHVQDGESNEALQNRFVDFMRDLFTRARSNESPEEIAETLLRRIGRGLSNKDSYSEGVNYAAERPKPKPEDTAHTANLKQSGTQGALLRAWRVLFEALGALQPLIIVVDDLQWADEALLDLLEYLIDRITSVPILILCPARPDFLEHRRDWGGGHRNFTAIELESLSWDESSNLIDTLLHTKDLPEALRYTILSRAEGNPFFVEEIVRMLIDQGILIRKDNNGNGQGGWHVNVPGQTLMGELPQPVEHAEESLLSNSYLLPLPHVPDTVQGVLTARVDLLGSTEKLVLQHASIVGRSFWLSSLIELSSGIDIETVLQALASLIKGGFLIEIEKTKSVTTVEPNDQVFNFKHILIRDVVYNNIPRQRRSREHARLALWLDEKTEQQRETFIELLAYHYQQALITWSPNSTLDYIEIEPGYAPHGKPIRFTREMLRDRAIKYLIMTGDQAMHSYYSLRALRAYGDAYELLNEGHSPIELRCKLREKLGDAYTQRGNLDEAWQQYRQTLQIAKEENVTLSDEQLLCLYEKLSLLATRWLARFDTLPEPQAIRDYINAGLQILEGQEISRKHIAFLTYQAFWYIRQLEEAPSEEKAELADMALSSGNQALELAERLDNPRTLSLTLDALGFIYYEYHRYNKSLQLQERRLSLESLITDREEIYDLYVSLGSAYEQVADYATALTYFGRAWSHALAMESPGMVLTSMVGRMRAWRQWNRWDDAQQVALEILQFIEKYQQDEKRQLWALETLSTIAYHRGNQEEGDQYARQYKRLIDLQVERSKSEAKALIEAKLHAIHHAQEDWRRALADYKEKLRRSEPFPSPEVLSTLAEITIEHGENNEEQENICDRAVIASRQAGARKSLGIALRARGRYYLKQQQWKHAEDDLRHALQCSEKLDLPWEKGHTLYYLGKLYTEHSANTAASDKEREGDLSRAHYYFEQALGFYESLKAAPSIERIHTELRRYSASQI